MKAVTQLPRRRRAPGPGRADAFGRSAPGPTRSPDEVGRHRDCPEARAAAFKFAGPGGRSAQGPPDSDSVGLSLSPGPY